MSRLDLEKSFCSNHFLAQPSLIVFTTYIESETIIKLEGSLNHFNVSRTAIASILLFVVPILPFDNLAIILFLSSQMILAHPPVFVDDLKLPSV